MQEARECAYDVAKAIRDGLRQIEDCSYAILPRDLAHACGDFNKAVLGSIRSAIDWQIGWIDERVAGGDKLRDEWRERCRETTADATSQPGV